MKSDNFKICKNSLTGKHKWLVKEGKNKNKLDQCVLCQQLKSDLRIKENEK